MMFMLYDFLFSCLLNAFAYFELLPLATSVRANSVHIWLGNALYFVRHVKAINLGQQKLLSLGEGNERLRCGIRYVLLGRPGPDGYMYKVVLRRRSWGTS